MSGRRGPNQDLRLDLQAALERCQKDDELTLADLAQLCRTSKQNFVNNLRVIERMFDVPAYRDGPRGVHIYPAKKMIEVLLAFETRNDADSEKRQTRLAVLLGKGKKKTVGRDALPINEMATASRIAAETEERERTQGLYARLDDMAVTAGNVFAMVSGYLSELEAHIDPNGVLAAEVRADLRAGGRRLNLQIHAEMKDMLSGNAVPQSKRSSKARGANGRAGGASPRRPRG